MKIIYKEQDISEYVASMTWSGSRSEVARKLELKVINAPTDDNITPPTLELAEYIYLFDDNGAELFRGFITDREASSESGEITYTAYDLLFYALKSTATYNFSGKTAEAIAKMVCEDVEIPIGSLASTGISQKLIVQNVSIYEIIMQAYTQAHQQNGVSYRVTAKAGALNVEEMGKVTCTINLSDETNINTSKYTETIGNMVNKVRIYDGEGNQVGVVQNDEDLKYGIFQQTYTKEEGKNPTTTAKSMFKGIEKTFDLTCTNYNECVTGSGVEIRDISTGLSGLVWIDADSHTWQNGVASMSLTVTLKYIMDTKDFTVEKKSSSDKSGGGSSGGGSSGGGTATVKNGSRDKPPFKIGYKQDNGVIEWDTFEIDSWDMVVHELISLDFIMLNPTVLDKDGNEVELMLPTDSWYNDYVNRLDPKKNAPFMLYFVESGSLLSTKYTTIADVYSNSQNSYLFAREHYILDADNRYVQLTYADIKDTVAGAELCTKNDSPFSVVAMRGNVITNTVLASGFINYTLADNYRKSKDLPPYTIKDKEGRFVWNYGKK